MKVLVIETSAWGEDHQRTYKNKGWYAVEEVFSLEDVYALANKYANHWPPGDPGRELVVRGPLQEWTYCWGHVPADLRALPVIELYNDYRE